VAPRAYWKGYLKLSLVSCPVALFPASSEREKISFNQINKKTGNRIRYRKVDAETGDEVDSADIIKGYEVGKGQYIEIQPEELEAIAIESKRTIERSTSSCLRKKSTSCIYIAPIISHLMAKSANRRSRLFARRSARKAWWRSGGLCSFATHHFRRRSLHQGTRRNSPRSRRHHWDRFRLGAAASRPEDGRRRLSTATVRSILKPLGVVMTSISSSTALLSCV
jgi:Ku70/Ku80 beta-barrel domain